MQIGGHIYGLMNYRKSILIILIFLTRKRCVAVDKKELNIKKLEEFREQMSGIQGKLKRRTNRMIGIRDMDKDIILNGVTSIVTGVLLIIGVMFAAGKFTWDTGKVLMIACILIMDTVFMIIIPSIHLSVALHNRQVLKTDIKVFESEILMAYEKSNKALKLNEVRDEVIVGAIAALQSFGVEDIEDAMKYYYDSIERVGNKEFNTLLEIDSTMKYKDRMNRFAYKIGE